MHKTFLSLGAAIAGLGVILGAFGAHKLKEMAPDAVPVFQTGVQYQLYHALALILLGIVYDKFPVAWITRSGYAFVTGIILFSGSLYALSLLKATGKAGLGGLGVLTPIGGLFFILGWVFFLLAVKGK